MHCNYLLFWSYDVHPTQDEALSLYVALETCAPRSLEVLQYPQTEHAHPTHPPWLLAIEGFLEGKKKKQDIRMLQVNKEKQLRW